MEAKTVKSLYDRAYDITMHELEGNVKNVRYVGQVVIPGLYPTLAHNYGLGRSDEVVKGMKDALFNFIGEYMYDGIEPEFASDEAFEWWEGLNDSFFETMPSGYHEGELRLKEKAPTPLFV